jgi:hypothetical protein
MVEVVNMFDGCQMASMKHEQLNIPKYCDKGISGEVEVRNFVVTTCLELSWKSWSKLLEAPVSG